MARPDVNLGWTTTMKSPFFKSLDLLFSEKEMVIFDMDYHDWHIESPTHFFPCCILGNGANL